ncbi:MAG: hypothetical protein J7605_02445 [Variovorax sp.]|nr:hypothetical protein [Variovorax sp.]
MLQVQRATFRAFQKVPVSAVVIFLCAALFLIISRKLLVNNVPFLDDYYLIKEQQLFGYWAPSQYYRSIWGYYRIVYTTLMSIVFGASEYTWALRLIGVSFHCALAILMLLVIKRVLGELRPAFIAFGVFLFFPYAYEAVAWPSNIGQYPLAPLIAMLGAWVICRKDQPSATAVVVGGVLMAFSFWIHEQAGPLILALALFLMFSLNWRRRIVLLGLVFASIACNLLLIYLTREGNNRLSGEHAASSRYLFENLRYLPQLFRTTPFGDLYYSTAGVAITWVSMIAVLAAMLIAYGAFGKASGPTSWLETFSPLRRDSVSFAAGVALISGGAYLVSLAPILLSPIPWHTGRVIYVPFVMFTFALAAALETVWRALPEAIRPRFRALLAAVLAITVVWQAHALQSEATAYDLQVRVNEARARAAIELLDRSRDLTDTSLLVVGGFPGSDNGRPQFGEHFIGMSLGQLQAMLGLRVYHPSDTPRIAFASGWDHLCRRSDGGVGVRESVKKTLYRPDEISSRNTTFLLWANGKWNIQRGNVIVEKDVLPLGLDSCSTR